MARARKKTYRSLNFTPSPEKKQIQTKQIVLTLAASNGDVIKIEKLEKSGQRREVTDEEFAELAGEDTPNLGAALEHAYTAGITDALNNELSEDEEDEKDEEEILRRFILKRAAGRQLLRRGVRRIILRRALRRRLAERRARPQAGAAPE
jgi:hypothetical protein